MIKTIHAELFADHKECVVGSGGKEVRTPALTALYAQMMMMMMMTLLSTLALPGYEPTAAN